MDDFMRFLPIFYKDSNEPFSIEAIGVTEYSSSSKSVSSKHFIEFTENTKKVLEYAIYWDFDIQHLYDLEHVFIYIGKNDDIIDVISSFHGKFYRQTNVSFQKKRPILFIQPGKHAIMADPEYFRLYIDLISSCNIKAGIDKILIPDFLSGKISKSDKDDELISSYIKRNFSFYPSLEYVEEDMDSIKIMGWDLLLSKIPEYMKTRIVIASTE